MEKQFDVLNLNFRVWDKDKQQMGQVHNIDWDGFDPTVVGYYFNGQSMTTTNFELLQYTGCKDCKEQDIYVGDIINYHAPIYGERYLLQVVHYDVKYGDIDTGIRWDLLTQYGEVIGNIFENPELLEGKND